LRAQGEAHTRPKHNILDSEITIGSFLWPNELRRSKIKSRLLLTQNGLLQYISFRFKIFLAPLYKMGVRVAKKVEQSFFSLFLQKIVVDDYLKTAVL